MRNRSSTVCQLAIERTSPGIMLKQLHEESCFTKPTCESCRRCIHNKTSLYTSPYILECKGACRKWMGIKRLLLLRHTLDRWRRQAATFNDLKSAADQDGKRIKPVNDCSREWRGATKWPPNPLRVCVVSALWAKKNKIAWELYDSYIIMTVWQYIYSCIYIVAMILTKLPSVDLHNEFVNNRQ